jgi:transcriptional regulator with XRE-family HTH domain
MERFKTKGAKFDFKRASKLRNARLAAGTSISEAARRLDMPILRYALLENGETEFERPEAWEEALRIFIGDRRVDR